MIKSFKHKGLKRLYERGQTQDLSTSQVQKILDVFAALDTAEEPGDVGLFPGWRLHPLKGDLKDYWSVTITGNWRIIFRFVAGDAFDVDLIDYH